MDNLNILAGWQNCYINSLVYRVRVVRLRKAKRKTHSLSTWYADICLANTLFSILIRNQEQKKDQKKIMVTWDGQHYVNSLILCYNRSWSDLNHVYILQNFLIVHPIDDIMLIKLDELEMESTLEVLVRYMCCRRCRGSLHQWRFLGACWIAEC